MHTYEKRYIDAQGSYQIWQLRTDGSQRKVDEDYHGYLEWLALGNVPPEIEYVAPEVVEPVPSEIDLLKAQMAEQSTEFMGFLEWYYTAHPEEA